MHAQCVNSTIDSAKIQTLIDNNRNSLVYLDHAFTIGVNGTVQEFTSYAQALNNLPQLQFFSGFSEGTNLHNENEPLTEQDCKLSSVQSLKLVNTATIVSMSSFMDSLQCNMSLDFNEIFGQAGISYVGDVSIFAMGCQAAGDGKALFDMMTQWTKYPRNATYGSSLIEQAPPASRTNLSVANAFSSATGLTNLDQIPTNFGGSSAAGAAYPLIFNFRQNMSTTTIPSSGTFIVGGVDKIADISGKSVIVGSSTSLAYCAGLYPSGDIVWRSTGNLANQLSPSSGTATIYTYGSFVNINLNNP